MGGRGSNSMNRILGGRKWESVVRQGEAGIRNNSFETGIVYDRTGKELFRETQNDKNNVAFTVAQCSLMKDAILTHNHPTEKTFSVDDVETLVKNDLYIIRATSAGKTFELERIDNKPKYDRSEFFPVFHDMVAVELFNNRNTYNNATKDWLNGDITTKQYHAICDKLEKDLDKEKRKWLKRNAKLYGYRYKEYK